jgi:hypothetical protein
MRSRGIGVLDRSGLTRAVGFTVGLLVAVLIFALSANTALADTEIGSSGTGAGQTTDPQGAAVDETDGLLYVADRGNNRIDVFNASTGVFVKAFGWGVLNGASELQVCTATCLPGLTGSGAGQLKAVQGIAVDNDSTSAGFHSIYVFDVGNRRVQKFNPAGEFVWMIGDGVNVTTGGDLCTKASGDVCGPGTQGDAAGQLNAPEGDTIDVGPGGTVYVGDRVVDGGVSKTRVQLYSQAGAYLGYLGGKLLEVAGGAGATTTLAVDSDGNVYVGTNGETGTGAVRKYSPSGTELISFNPSSNVNNIAVGPEDNVFVGDASLHEGELNSGVYEYDPDGVLLRVIYGSLLKRTFGLAVYSNPNGDIFAVEEGLEGKKRILNVEFPPPGPVVYPKPSTLFAGPVGNTKATLNGKVSSENEATTYYFEYITDEDFIAAGNSYGAGTVKTPEAGPLPADFTLRKVQAEITGLITETKYHFRIVVKSAAAPAGNPGPDTTFETKPPIEFGDTWSGDVTTTSATLNIEANPLGIAATGRFEYIELSRYEASGFAEALQAPAGSEEPIDLGEGEEMLVFSATASSLKPGTAYRYRFVATNRCKPEPASLCEFAEPEGTFVTFLPIQPATGCPNDARRAEGSGTFLPDCRGYEMVSPVDKNGAFIEPVFSISGFPAGLDQAAVDGNSISFSAYKAFGEVDSAPYTNQYLSRRGPGGWSTEGISPEREGPSIMTYLSAQLDRQYKGFSADLCSGWVVQDANPILASEGIAGFPGLYRRDNCDPGTGSYEALTTLEPPATEPPNLAPRKFIPELQGSSADGSVTVFSVNDNLTVDAPPQPSDCVDEKSASGEACESRLYEARAGQLEFVCILPGGSPNPGPCGAGTPSEGSTGRTANVSNAISDDGSRIFWSASGNGPGPLYVRIDGSETIEISSEDVQFLTASADGSVAIYSADGELFEYDVDAEDENLIAEGLIGFAGASEDASRIYFASTKVLTGEEENSDGDKAVAGQPNLYLYEEGAGFEFVGTLDTSDLTSGLQPSSPLARNPVGRLSRVTPDGQKLVFMSSASLTGYDNKDAATAGKIAMEVFLFDATAEQLLCPSCNPSGARPEGRELTRDLKLLEGRWAAARIPVYETQLQGQRVITDDGNRLYFNSYDSLVSTDTNGKEDVYEWRAPGTGSCDVSDPTYHETSGGCVDLISSGKSPQGSELVDISTNGRDVFFKTTESLVNQDPGLRDIYDARIEGGFEAMPAKPVICQGEACPQPLVAAPTAVAPTSRLPGPGNPPQSKPKPKKCPKGTHKVKRKGKVRCVKNKKPRKGKAGKQASKTRRTAR